MSKLSFEILLANVTSGYPVRDTGRCPVPSVLQVLRRMARASQGERLASNRDRDRPRDRSNSAQLHLRQR